MSQYADIKRRATFSPETLLRLATAYNALADCLVYTEDEATHEAYLAAQERVFSALCREINKRSSYTYHPRSIECMALSHCNSIR